MRIFIFNFLQILPAESFTSLMLNADGPILISHPIVPHSCHILVPFNMHSILWLQFPSNWLLRERVSQSSTHALLKKKKHTTAPWTSLASNPTIYIYFHLELKNWKGSAGWTLNIVKNGEKKLFGRVVKGNYIEDATMPAKKKRSSRREVITIHKTYILFCLFQDFLRPRHLHLLFTNQTVKSVGKKTACWLDLTYTLESQIPPRFPSCRRTEKHSQCANSGFMLNWKMLKQYKSYGKRQYDAILSCIVQTSQLRFFIW